MLRTLIQAPSFKDIDVTLGSSSARLKCSATGDPAPTIYWIEPSGRTTKYASSTDEDVRHNDGLLTTRDLNGSHAPFLHGTYVCIASNEAGNVTLSINISLAQQKWAVDTNRAPDYKEFVSNTILDTRKHSAEPFIVPPILSIDGGVHSRNDDVILRRHGDTGLDWARVNYSVINHVTVHHADLSTVPSQHRVDVRSPRLFTTLELSGAVVGTHVITMILCLVIVSKCYRHRRAILSRPVTVTTRSAHVTLPAQHVVAVTSDSFTTTFDKMATDKMAALSRDELNYINDSRTRYFTPDYASIKSHINSSRVS